MEELAMTVLIGSNSQRHPRRWRWRWTVLQGRDGADVLAGGANVDLLSGELGDDPLCF